MTRLNIGERNADFVLRYLLAERIRVCAQDLRGKLPRRINFFPFSGRVTVRKLRQQDGALLVQREEQALAGALLRPHPSSREGRLAAAAVPARDNTIGWML